jgi:hypothetical protein
MITVDCDNLVKDICPARPRSRTSVTASACQPSRVADGCGFVRVASPRSTNRSARCAAATGRCSNGERCNDAVLGRSPNFRCWPLNRTCPQTAKSTGMTFRDIGQPLKCPRRETIPGPFRCARLSEVPCPDPRGGNATALQCRRRTSEGARS